LRLQQSANALALCCRDTECILKDFWFALPALCMIATKLRFGARKDFTQPVKGALNHNFFNLTINREKFGL